MYLRDSISQHDSLLEHEAMPLREKVSNLRFNPVVRRSRNAVGLPGVARATCGLVLFVVGCLAVGCDSRPPITRYTVSKEPVQQPTVTKDDRMVVGIGLHDESAWFFKLVGTKEQIEQVQSEFDAFLESISFAEASAGVPKWDAPETWQRRPGTSFRFATYELPNGPEVAISKLSFQSDLDEYLRINVDRWRREMGLSPTPASADIRDAVESIDKEPGQFFVLRLEGAYSGGAMGSAPFANQGANPPRVPTTPSGPSAKVSEYTLPEGWVRGQQTQFSQLSLNYESDKGTARITVSNLPAEINRWDQNVIRWAGQLKANLEPNEVAAATEEVTVDGVASKLIALPLEAFGNEASDEIADTNAIIAAMSVHGETAWFIRLAGDLAVVKEQQQAFRDFLQTIQFEP